MTTTSDSTKSDRDAAIRRQQERANGDLSAVAARMVLVAEQLCDSADLHAGWRVLDVATGSGNGALAAARLGCTAVGVDDAPILLERARRRASAEGLCVEFVQGGAESLPFPDASFDAVTSVFGCMFAADHARAAAELLRVCKSGGTIALASWMLQGFVGELFRTLEAHVPPPASVPSPIVWGAEEYLRHHWGDGVASFEVAERTFSFRFPAAEHLVAFLRLWYAPVAAAFAALEGPARDTLESDLVALAHRFDRLRSADAVAIPAGYLEAVALTR